MAPIRSAMFARRRSSLSLLSTRRRSLVVPKSYTFAPNLTPISYPSDRTDPTGDESTNTPPSPLSPSSSPSSASPTQPLAGEPDADTKPDIMDASDAATTGAGAVELPMPPPTRPRRRGPRRDSVEHIPRPPNAFMLFRQNFVHQRHVPGSIETNHNSLSRIVGNHWKALPATEKKRWEQLADKKKEEHKRLYPDYRFQPKHDPEKKRRRQEAKAAAEAAAIRDEQQRRADEERKRREIEGLALPTSPLAMPMPISGTMSANVGTPVDEAQQSMQLRRNQERERRAQHFGHRRSSSVPLPMDTYAYPYAHAQAQAHGYAFPPAFSAQAQANPFNFANPAAGANSQSNAGAGAGANANSNANGVQQIALPTLPTMGAETTGGGLSNLSNMLPAWYADTNTTNTTTTNNNNSTEQHAQSLSAGATPASGELQLPSHLQGPFDPSASSARQHQQAATTLSRAGSPRLAHSLRSNVQQTQQFAPQQGMGMLGNMALYNQMHMGLGLGPNMNINMNTNGGMSSYMNMHSGMNAGMGMGMGMGMPMNNGLGSGMPLGMGARAARQHQLGQLGRRASSTQPVLQHQLASGAFAHFGSGAHANNSAFSFTPTTAHAPALPPPSASVGFTNPFASSAVGSSNSGNGDGNGAMGAMGAAGEGVGAGVNGFPHPFAPQSIWFDGGALPDGAGTGAGAEPEPLPEVDSYLLNPAFRFGASTAGGSEGSTTATTANNANTNSNSNSNSNDNNSSNSSNGTPPPPASAGAGPRGSFDFTAIMMNLPRAGRGAGANNGDARYARAPNVDVSISPLENIPPHQQVPVPVPTLAQPVPLRKVAVPVAVAESEVYPAQEYHYAPHYVSHGQQQQQQHGQQQLQGRGMELELEYVYGGGGGAAHAHAQEYFQNSQPSSVASGSPDLSASGSGSGSGSPHGFGAMEMHSQESQTQSQSQSQSQESTPTEMRPLPHARDTVAGTELLDGAHPQQYEQQYEQYEQHPQQQQQQFEHQGQSVYAEAPGQETGPLSASLGGSMGVGADPPGALGLYYDHQHAHQHQQHQHQYQLEQQQQQQHGEDLQTYMSAAAGVCSGVDVLDNYALGLPLPLPLPVSVSVSGVDRHGHHAHGYADPASAAQGFEFSDFVHDSPYLGTGAMGAAAN